MKNHGRLTSSAATRNSHHPGTLALLLATLMGLASPGQAAAASPANTKRMIHVLALLRLGELAEGTGLPYSLIETSDLTRTEARFTYEWSNEWKTVEEAVAGFEAQSSASYQPGLPPGPDESWTHGRPPRNPSGAGVSEAVDAEGLVEAGAVVSESAATVGTSASQPPGSASDMAAPGKNSATDIPQVHTHSPGGRLTVTSKNPDSLRANEAELEQILRAATRGDGSAAFGPRWSFDAESRLVIVRTRSASSVLDLTIPRGTRYSGNVCEVLQTISDAISHARTGVAHSEGEPASGACRFGGVTADIVEKASLITIAGTTEQDQTLADFIRLMIVRDNLRLGVVVSTRPLEAIAAGAPIRLGWLVVGGRLAPKPGSE